MDEAGPKVAIPRSMLRDLYMTSKAEAALTTGLCPSCCQTLEVVDTWERACPALVCGYTFNYYEWPWVSVPLFPEREAE